MSLAAIVKGTGRLGRMPGPVSAACLALSSIGVASYVLILGEWMDKFALSESDWRYVTGTFFITAFLILAGSSTVFAAGRVSAGDIDATGSGKDVLTVGGHGRFRSMDSAGRIVTNSFSLFFVNLILFILYNLDTPTTTEGLANAAEGIRGMRILLLAASIPVISSLHNMFMYAFETKIFAWFVDILGLGGKAKTVNRM